ncbi:MAG: hypothetical protein H5U29_00015 [Pusillimonas sp.]|nr:hypothetical protein [Pusillimonas sp.]
MNQDQRAAFEAWYVEQYGEPAGQYTASGFYIDHEIQGEWRGYQAALASPEVQGLRDVLERCRLALEPYDDVKPRDWKSDRENLRYAHQAVCDALAAMEKQK